LWNWGVDGYHVKGDNMMERSGRPWWWITDLFTLFSEPPSNQNLAAKATHRFGWPRISHTGFILLTLAVLPYVITRTSQGGGLVVPYRVGGTTE
jgi:hypothetical protein